MTTATSHRASKTFSAATVKSAAIVATGVFLYEPQGTAPWIGLLAAALTVYSVSRREAALGHLVAFLMGAALTTSLVPSLMVWPFHLLLPLGAYGTVVLALPFLRRSFAWPRRGQFGRGVWFLVACSAGVGLAGLAIWVALTNPDLDTLVRQFPQLPAGLLVLAGLGFAAVNACLEEAVFRGVLQDALAGSVNSPISGILIQAALFGVLHFREGAFPHGLIGVAMTTAYGLLLGWVKHRSGGLAAPCIAHGIADLAVFVLVGIAAGAV